CPQRCLGPSPAIGGGGRGLQLSGGEPTQGRSRDAKASYEPSKIRLVRCRDRCVLSGIVFMRVLGADDFRPITRGAQISYGGRPGHGEDAFILARELELKL